MKTQSDNAARSVPLHRFVRRLWCSLRGHRVWLYNEDGSCALKGRDEDGMVMADCADCGKPLKAICGLSLPGFRLGTNPRPTNDKDHSPIEAVSASNPESNSAASIG